MAALVFRKLSTYDAQLLLRGGLQGGPLAEAAPVVSPTIIYGLHNKTLIFTTPGVTVTFSDATGAGLNISQVVAQIQAALTAAYVVRATARSIQIEAATPGVIVMLGTGTANPQLGFGDITQTTIKYNAPSGAAPRLIQVVPVDGSTLLIVTEE
jgi:hypothetical protein